jgi:hypothetical protein
MRKIFLLSGFVALTVYAADKYVGTIESTTTNISKNNVNTTRPFSLTKGGRYAVQCDVEACVASGKSSSETVVCAGYYNPGDGGSMWLGGADAGVAIKLPKKTIFDLPLAAADDVIHAVATDGGATCDVYAVTP